MKAHITHIIKRDGKLAPFDKNKIILGISKAIKSTGESNKNLCEEISEEVFKSINKRFKSPRLPRVEDVQDIVEEILVAKNLPKIAKSYIIYRYECDKKKLDEFYQIDNKITRIIKRDGKIVPFDKNKINTAIYKSGASLGIHEKDEAEKLTNQVLWHLNNSFSSEEIPSVEETQDIIEKVLIENKLSDIAKAYIIYRENRNKARAERNKEESSYDTIPYKKVWEILSWNIEHSCETIEKLNEHIRSGSINKLILAAEEFYHEDVKKAAEKIINLKDNLKLVIIAGPSSSGKTTTTTKLSEFLKKEKIKFVALNIDNYFYDLECQPKDEFGDYDFETPEALDLPLINKHLKDLLSGEKIEVPRYNFKTGKREAETDSLQLKENEIVLIDTLHGLYEGMTKLIPEENKFKLYIETLNQIKDNNGLYIRWTDIRLLRRMIRDKSQRAYNPRETLAHWHYVRRSELKHIIPYISKANYIINGSLCYELPVLKKYLFEYFPQFINEFKEDKARQDAYIRAKRIFEIFNTVEAIKDDSCIPNNSLIREFIGGSIYKY